MHGSSAWVLAQRCRVSGMHLLHTVGGVPSSVTARSKVRGEDYKRVKQNRVTGPTARCWLFLFDWTCCSARQVRGRGTSTHDPRPRLVGPNGIVGTLLDFPNGTE
jgi:hypothetical protein